MKKLYLLVVATIVAMLYALIIPTYQSSLTAFASDAGSDAPICKGVKLSVPSQGRIPADGWEITAEVLGKGDEYRIYLIKNDEIHSTVARSKSNVLTFTAYPSAPIGGTTYYYEAQVYDANSNTWSSNENCQFSYRNIRRIYIVMHTECANSKDLLIKGNVLVGNGRGYSGIDVHIVLPNGERPVVKFYEWRGGFEYLFEGGVDYIGENYGVWVQEETVAGPNRAEISETITEEMFANCSGTGPTGRIYVDDDGCDGWKVYYIPDVTLPDKMILIGEGIWKNKSKNEKVDFYEPKYMDTPITIYEPLKCYVCDEKLVQVFNDGWCIVFVREPHIDFDMTRPNDWSQNKYCACNYAHPDGWTVDYVSSCTNPGEYEYYMSKPIGCGALSCP